MSNSTKNEKESDEDKILSLENPSRDFEGTVSVNYLVIKYYTAGPMRMEFISISEITFYCTENEIPWYYLKHTIKFKHWNKF
jgi:hypothetical protein